MDENARLRAANANAEKSTSAGQPQGVVVPKQEQCTGKEVYKPDGSYGPMCPEEEVVFADRDGRLREFATEINRARFLLEFLETKTTNSKREIADNAFRTSEMIKKNYGLEYSTLKVLEECRSVVQALPSSAKKEEIRRITFVVYSMIGQR
jgi:hypothetical protein